MQLTLYAYIPTKVRERRLKFSRGILSNSDKSYRDPVNSHRFTTKCKSELYFVCLFVYYSRQSNFSPIQRLSPLPVSGIRHLTATRDLHPKDRHLRPSHSGIRTGDARITRSLRLRSNHYATRAASKEFYFVVITCKCNLNLDQIQT
jgi:hypothetical protein